MEEFQRHKTEHQQIQIIDDSKKVDKSRLYKNEAKTYKRMVEELKSEISILGEKSND